MLKIKEYPLFSKNNDGEKMALMEKYLSIALASEHPTEWIFLFLEIAHLDKSPCVAHEAVFNIGQVYAKQINTGLADCAEFVATEFCKLVESTESMVVKHETMESMGDAGFNTPQILKLLKRYSENSNYDLANTARISYWQITGKGYDKNNDWNL